MKRGKQLLLFCGLLVVCGCNANQSERNETTKEQTPLEQVATDEIASVTFSAVGDNLIHNTIYMYNEVGNGTYNFKDIYEHTNYLTSDADISYINQETICGGNELGLSSYPSFNSPYEILDAVHNSGFNWMASCSNHSMDAGEQGIINQLNYMKANYPEITVTGTHTSLEDSQKLQVIDKNGVNIGVLGYTYGLNGYTLPQGKEYLVDVIDKDKIKKDVERLSEISDVIVVSMHWGQEYMFSPNDEQKELAQYLSDLGVDVIIGEHPHVIQPMDYVTGKNGNQTLVIYSLGNFLSAQDQADSMLGGMARWTLEYNKTKKEVAFKNVEFWPTITYIRGNMEFYRTYVLKDYTNEEAKTHMLTTKYGQDVSREYFIKRVHEIMNDKIKIVYE